MATAPVQAVQLAIGGMSCAGCAQGVTDALRQLPGVELAEVNFATTQARVVFDSERVDLNALVAAVTAAGFTAAEATDRHREQPDTALGALQQRLALAALPTLVLMTVMIYCAITQAPHNQHHQVLTLVLAFPVVVIAGWPTYVKAWQSLRRGQPAMEVLISLGTLPPYLAGFVPMMTVFAEVAAMVMAVHIGGRYLEARARKQATAVLNSLMQLQAKEAHLKQCDRWVDVPVAVLQVRDRVLVKAGERLPVDGVVVVGSSAVNEAIATGESEPVLKQIGDPVIGGTINQAGSLEIEIQRDARDSFVAQMIRLVEETQTRKVPIQQLADRLTAVFVPMILLLSASTFGLWYWGYDVLQPWLMQLNLPWLNPHLSRLPLAGFQAVAVLVVACPCALGLATPIAIMVGSGRGAAAGLLLRDGAAIQALPDVTTVVLDKTGTLTLGKPSVNSIMPVAADPDTILFWAATAEQGTSHPLAQALQRSEELPELASSETLPGCGVRAVTLAGETLMVGNPRWLATQLALDTEAIPAAAQIGVVRNQVLLGWLDCRDQLHPEAGAVVAALQQRGLAVHLLSGDRSEIAIAISQELGISHVKAEVLPAEKVDYIRALQAQGERVLMVGDGINDAAALTQADVGIAVRQGTDIALAAADIVVGGLGQLPLSFSWAESTLRAVRHNLRWAYLYNVLAVPLAIAGLLHPIMAEIAMALSSLTVIWNSLRIPAVVAKSR